MKLSHTCIVAFLLAVLSSSFFPGPILHAAITAPASTGVHTQDDSSSLPSHPSKQSPTIKLSTIISVVGSPIEAPPLFDVSSEPVRPATRDFLSFYIFLISTATLLILIISSLTKWRREHALVAAMNKKKNR